MFVQVIQGRVRHAEPVYVELDAWMKEIGPGTQGWLGSTAGVTSDKRFIALARWESPDAAARHSARPEQDHWWRAFGELFEDFPTVRETSDVVTDLRREPYEARFVQVMQGRSTDPRRAYELAGTHSDEWRGFRPEILGTMACLHDDDAYTVAAYFTDEQAAREGERRTPPPELATEMDEVNSLAIGMPEYYDLGEPWIHSPSH